MSSDRFNRNIQFLQFIAKPPSRKQRQSMIKSATQDQVLAICEIVLNALEGNIDLTPTDIKTISVYKKDLRRAGTRKRTPWTSRRAILLKIGKVVSYIVEKSLK